MGFRVFGGGGSGGGAPAAVNFKATVRVAVAKLGAVLSTLGSTIVRPAVAITNWVGALVTEEKPALQLTGRLDGLVLENPALQLAPRLDAVVPESPAAALTQAGLSAAVVTELPAANMVQISWDLSHSSHVVAATTNLGATKPWANAANAQGAPDGTDSTYDGDALLLAVGVLQCSFGTQPVRGSLIIDQVWLDFYGQVTGLPVLSDLVSRLELAFVISGSTQTLLETINTGDTNFHATPKQFRIDNGSGAFIDTVNTPVTWANLTALLARWDAAIILGLVGAHYRADAVRLRILAHEVQVL